VLALVVCAAIVVSSPMVPAVAKAPGATPGGPSAGEDQLTRVPVLPPPPGAPPPGKPAQSAGSSPATAVPTTLLADGQGNAPAAVRADPDGRQLLALTFDDNPTLIQDLVLWYGLVSWVTNGLFLGERHTYLSPQDDDLFSPGDAWSSTQACGSAPSLSYRTTGADLTALITWQRGIQSSAVSQQVALSLAFIGAWSQPGAYTPDTLTPVVRANASQVRWINHTYQHPNFNTIDYATALAQVRQNNTVAAQLGRSPYSVQNLVMPVYGGLTNPAAMQAAFDAGVRTVATDVYRAGYANPSPNAGLSISGTYQGASYQLFGVPRRETNPYYDVSTPDQWLALDHCQWPAGQWGDAAGDSDLLARESAVLLRYMLSGDADPLGFHALNLRAYDGTHSLLSDLLDQVLRCYSALVNLPIVSLTMDGVATTMATRMQFDAARAQLSASVITSASGASVLQLNSAHAGTLQLTGAPASGAHLYGTALQAEVPVTAGGSVPPTAIASGAMGTILGPAPNTWYASTPLDNATVQARAGGLLSMSIDAPGSDILVFSARESGAATAPQLVLSYR
jgi:hypothetical protein